MVDIIKGEDRKGVRTNYRPRHILVAIGRKNVALKYDIFWTRFKGTVLCKGQGYLADILPWSLKQKDTRVIHKGSGGGQRMGTNGLHSYI